MSVLGVLTVLQLQQVVLAICAAAIVVIPVVGGIAVLVVQQYGKIKEAIGKLESFNGTLTHQTESIMSMRDHIAANQEQIGQIKGVIQNGSTGPIK